MLSYPAAVDLSSHTLRYATGLLREHRRVIGSRWRKLSARRQALLVLAHLRCGDTSARLAAGFGVGAQRRRVVYATDTGSETRPRRSVVVKVMVTVERFPVSTPAASNQSR